MNLDASTFALEVLNFLVLVWLLKRFLYRPVLDVVERRRAEDARTVADAQALKQEAQALKSRYEERLAHAAEDREKALAALDGEIAAERARRLAAVQTEAADELARRRGLDERDARLRDAERDRQAVALAARFATRLLDRLAGPALDDALAGLALQDLGAVPPDQRDALRLGLADEGAAVEVASARPLSAERVAALTAALQGLAGRSVQPAFVVEPGLRSGLRVSAGAWVLMANLRDELAFFGAGLDHGG